MADGTRIEWTDASLFGAPLPRRCSACREVKPISDFKVDQSRPDGHGYVCRGCERRTPSDEPNRIERAAARNSGVGWCRQCCAWHPLASMSKQGLCRVHQRAVDRRLYAENPAHRASRRQHAHARKRGVAPLPGYAQEILTETFEGLCAYCDQLATTWDHVIPVSRGGETVPGNILPACGTCNSSKRDRDLEDWLDATGREIRVEAVELLSLYGAI